MQSSTFTTRTVASGSERTMCRASLSAVIPAAAHEADHGPLDRAGRAEPIDDVDVQTWRIEAGAAGEYEVGHLRPDPAEVELRERGGGEFDRVLFEELHASARIGKLPGAVKPAALEAARGQERIAMVDLRSSYRFVKDIAFPAILNYRVRKSEKRRLNVEWGGRCSDLVYVYGIHKRAPLPRCVIYNPSFRISLSTEGFRNRGQSVRYPLGEATRFRRKRHGSRRCCRCDEFREPATGGTCAFATTCRRRFVPSL